MNVKNILVDLIKDVNSLFSFNALEEGHGETSLVERIILKDQV